MSDATTARADTGLINIALCGRFRSGKDAVGAYLTSKYGYTRFAFGDDLKRYYHELFGGGDVKDREGYQWFGQTMRERDPDIWVRKCFDAITYVNEVDDLFDVPLRTVITDLRQPNEYERCRSEGYVIIRVSAPDAIRLVRAKAAGDAFDEKTLTHDTESHVDGFDVDYDVVNDGTLEALYARVDEIIRQWAVTP